MHMIDSWVGANLIGIYSNYSYAILAFIFSLFFHVICWNIDFFIFFFFLYSIILNLLLFW